MYAAAVPTNVVRIARLHHPDFTFGVHYDAYFREADPTPAETLYEGPFPKDGYTDATAELSQTYSYFLRGPAGDGSDPLRDTPPAPIKVRDPEVWWPYARTLREMQRLADDHPDVVRLDTFGHTVADHPIHGLTVGNRGRCIALIGLLHAGEAGPELLLPALTRLLAEHRDLLDRCGIAVLPSVNRNERDRLVHGHPPYLRTNARGVDLNRNFDGHWHVVDHMYNASTADPTSGTYRGPTPASEPETRAVVRFIQHAAPRLVLSLHWLASVSGDRMLASKFVDESDTAYRDSAERVRAAFAAGFNSIPLPPLGPPPPAASPFDDLPEPHVEYISSAGTLDTWAHQRLGLLALDVEHYNDDAAQFCRFDHTTPPYLEAYRERYTQALAAVLHDQV